MLFFGYYYAEREDEFTGGTKLILGPQKLLKKKLPAGLEGALVIPSKILGANWRVSFNLACNYILEIVIVVRL